MRRLILFLFCPCLATAQDTLYLSRAIVLGQEHALGPKRERMEFTVAQQRLRYLDAEFKPQLSLGATLPNYYKTTTAITQPDGTLSFLPISQDNSSVNLYLGQRLRGSNTLLFGETRLRRYQDFTGSTQFNSVPFRLGLEQPLNQFNSLKWDRRRAELELEWRRSRWNIREAEVATAVTVAYFDLLTAQVNQEIALTNAENSEKIYTIALERDKLGKISKSDLLQLELSLNSAVQSSINAKRELIRANAGLKEAMGYGTEDDVIYTVKMPEELFGAEFEARSAADRAWENRPEKKEMEKLLLETERALEEASKNHGWQGTISATVGWVGTGARFPLSYDVPQFENLVQVSLRVPILDGGKRNWSKRAAETQQQFTVLESEVRESNFKQQVRQWVHQFAALKEEVALGETSLALARERYGIANERYLLNDISITDLSLAFNERDQAWRNYTNLLRAYWITYYTLRQLTL
jgi:outer membrane protein